MIKLNKLSLIFKNIAKLIKSQKIFLMFFVISQIVACLAIFFSIGAIHNTRNEQKDINIRSMYFEVTQQETENLHDFQKKTERILSIIPDDIISWASIEGYTSPDSSIEFNAFFKTTNNTILAYMTPEQISNGEKIAAVGEDYSFGRKNPGDKININDMEYTVSSVGSYISDIIIPIKAADPDFAARKFRIEFNSVPEITLANEIHKLIDELFPVQKEKHVPEIPDLVSVQFNRTMIITSAIVITIVVLNLSYCYFYLFIKRKKMLSVYMMCGSSNSAAADLMIFEAVIISTLCYLISVCLIKPFAPQISDIYPAAEMLYSFKFFVVVGAVYISLTAIILKSMFSTLLKKSTVELKRGI